MTELDDTYAQIIARDVMTKHPPLKGVIDKDGHWIAYRAGEVEQMLIEAVTHAEEDLY